MAVAELSLQLTCVNCGERFNAPPWPQVCCPACGMLGSPDRIGSHLLSIGWNCPHCHEPNDGSVNFCMTCGTGLASRCLRCEAPIYKAVCDQCGAHQERIKRFATAEARRATWLPLLQSHIQQELLSEMPPPNRDTRGIVDGWRAIVLEKPQSEEHSIRKPSNKKQPTRWRIRWGIAMILVGLFMLLISHREAVATQITPLVDQVAPVTDMLWQNMQEVWGQFEHNTEVVRQMSPEEQGYAILFGAGILMLSLLPVLLFVAGRLAKRLFP